MDPLTHGVVGLGLAALGGHPVSVFGLDAVTTAVLIGSLLPDGDIVFQVGGDLPYLRRHRAESHSLFSAALGSAIVAGGIHIIFNDSPGLAVLYFWALVGFVSHLLLDVGNSYGANILWPIYKKRITANWLPLFDPLLIALFLLPQWTPWDFTLFMQLWGTIGLSYVGWRFLGRYLSIRKVISEYLVHYHEASFGEMFRVLVLPTRAGFRCWDFLAESEKEFWVGRVTLGLRSRVNIGRRLPKQDNDPVIKAALDSPLGRFFSSFTPHCYVMKEEKTNAAVVRFFDLRYFLRGDFLHRGTAVFEGEELKRAVFQPYHPKRQVPMM